MVVFDKNRRVLQRRNVFDELVFKLVNLLRVRGQVDPDFWTRRDFDPSGVGLGVSQLPVVSLGRDCAGRPVVHRGYRVKCADVFFRRNRLANVHFVASRVHETGSLGQSPEVGGEDLPTQIVRLEVVRSDSLNVLQT